MELAGKITRAWLAAFLAVCLCVLQAQAAELKPDTVAGFDRYVAATEARMDEDLRAGRFLVLDGMGKARMDRIYARVRSGQIYIEELHTLNDGQAINVPHGLMHHWAGVIFIPGATLSRTLQVLQDYDNHKNVYKPNVQDSKLLEHDGNEFRTYLRFHRKSLVTVTYNTNYWVRYSLLGDGRSMSKTYSTRIAEVADAGEHSEHELPVGNDHGYLWRLYTYSRVEEKDGGVYFQMESIALTRTVPFIFAWLVNPLIRSIPRAVLSDLLSATRRAVTGASAREAVPADEPSDEKP